MEKMIKKKRNKLTVVDFFCGAGIGAVGAEYAGFKTVFAFDNNKHAVKAYNINSKEPVAKVVDAKNLKFSDVPHANIYTGGFPCQPFSLSGKKLGKDDPEKGNLGMIISSFILNNEPDGFLLENVGGIANKRNKAYLNELIEYLSTKYDVTCEKINCADYGVPQDRIRVFIIGTRKDIKGNFVFPDKSNKKYTINDALHDLPKTPDNHNNHDYNTKFFLRKDEKPFIHKIPLIGNWKNLEIEDQKTFMKGAFYSGGGRTGFLRKIDPNKQAKTIMSSPMGKSTAQIIDWGIGEPRRFTVRESLRLQTVPDHFYFPNDILTSKQYERCSGIPSLVSYKLMLALEKAIKQS